MRRRAGIFLVVLSVVIGGVSSVGAYYTHPLSYQENKLLDKILAGLEGQVSYGLTTWKELEERLEPWTHEFDGTEYDEFLELLYDEVLIRLKYDIRGYAKSVLPTPILSSPDFAGTWGGSTLWTGGYGLQTDEREMIRGLVAVALPGTVFTIAYETQDSAGNTIYAVYTRDIMPPPNSKVWFIDARFVARMEVKPPQRTVHLPTYEEIVEKLWAAEGKRYVWGGSFAAGIPEMGYRYPYPSNISEPIRQLRTLDGVDCSGLIYEATNGWTPRNTALLLNVGQGIAIEGKTPEQIAAILHPLDLIVWRGHTIIVLDDQNVIESRHDYDLSTPGPQGGVRIRPIITVLNELKKQRFPVNYYDENPLPDTKKYVVRRWWNG